MSDSNFESAVVESDSPEFPPPISTPQSQRATKPSYWLGVIPLVLLAAFCVVAVRMDDSSRSVAVTPPPAETQTTVNSEVPAPATGVLPNFLNPPVAVAPSVPNTANPTLPKSPLTQPSTGGVNPALTAPGTTAPALSPPALTPSAPQNAGGAAHPALPIFQRGEAALKANNLPGAMREYESALRVDAGYAPALERAIAIALENKKPQQATGFLEAAAKNAPANPALRVQLSQLYLQTGQAPKAEAAAREAVRVARDAKIKRATQGNLAQVLAATGKHAAAYAQWTALAKANASDAEAALAAAVLADGALKKPADAKSWLAKAAKAPVSNPDVTVTLAGVLARTDKLKDAERILGEGARKFPQHIPLHIALAEARLARGDAKAATGTLKTVMTRVPDAAVGGQAKGELHLALAKVYASQKQWKAAEQETQRAAKLTPKHPAPQALLAEIRFASSDVKGGILALRRVLELAPQNAEARVLLARALSETRQFAAAKQELQTVLKQQPKQGEVVAELAEVHEASGDKKQALALWTSLAKEHPKNPLPALQQARLMAALGQDKNALERYRFVLQMRPKQPHALAGAAEIEEKTGDAARALAHLKTLVAAQPQYAPAYEALVRVAKKQKQMPATVTFLKEQLAKNPDRPGAYAAILEHYETRGEAEDGRSFVKGYIDKHPKLAAPRVAIDEFDLRRAKSMLSDLEKRGSRGTSDGRGTNQPRTPRGSTLPTPPPAGESLKEP